MADRIDPDDAHGNPGDQVRFRREAHRLGFLDWAIVRSGASHRTPSGRMSAGASAVVMAGDVATPRTSGWLVQCCGEAHVPNLGGYAVRDGTLVFATSDFDETLPGRWEWDVKRLAGSFEIAARARGFDAKLRK